MASSTRTVNVKFDGDAQGLRRAAKDGEREVDRFSKSVDKKFRKSGDDSGKNFNQALKKWFSPSSLGEVGKTGGTVFGSGFLGALKTPVLGPAIVGALGAAVAVAAPAVGAIAASGIVAGFGAGLAGLGIMFAAKSQKVKDTWSKTLSGMGADMTKLSKPFESTLISIAGFAQRTFDRFKPSLEAVFKDMAPAVTKFVDQFSRGLEKLQPAIRPLSEAFGAVLDKLGPATQSAIGKVSDGLTKLAESVKKNPDGLADLVNGVGDLTRSMLGLVTGLNNAYGGLKKFLDNIPILGAAMDKANLSTTDYATLIAGGVVPGLGLAKNASDALSQSTDKTTGAVGLTGDALKLYTQGLDENQVKSVLAGQSADGLKPKIESLATAYNRQWQATQKANQELFRNSGLLLTLSGSEISYQQAVDDATESVKQNGKTHDINTAAGRANKTALDNMANAANAQSEASRNAGKASVASATSAQKAYEKQAVQMGYTKSEAHRMAQEFIKIPPKVEADFKGDITDLDSKIKTAKQQLADPKLSATKKAKLEAYIGQLLAQKKAAQAAIDALHGKTVIVTTKYTTVGSRSSGSGSGGGRVNEDSHRASGGYLFAGRSYLLGERAAERVDVDSSGRAKVVSGEQTARELGNGAAPMYLETHIEIGGEVVRVVRSELKQSNRDLKRTVGAR